MQLARASGFQEAPQGGQAGKFWYHKGWTAGCPTGFELIGAGRSYNHKNGSLRQHRGA